MKARSRLIWSIFSMISGDFSIAVVVMGMQQNCSISFEFWY